MDETIAMGRHLKEYQRSWGKAPEEAYFELTARELTAILQSEIPYPILLDIQDDTVDAKLNLPAEDGCYPVTFRGGVVVENGRMNLVPAQLLVGTMNVSRLMSDRSFHISADNVPDEHSAELLSNVQKMTVEDGRFRFLLVDPTRRIW